MAVPRLAGWLKTPLCAHREAVVSPARPLTQSALLMGWAGGTTALLDVIPRSLVQAGDGGTPSPLAEHPEPRSNRSHGAGQPALSAKRLAAGWMAGTMALLASVEPSTMRQRADTMTAHQRAG
jgi:hypothetical protein